VALAFVLLSCLCAAVLGYKSFAGSSLYYAAGLTQSQQNVLFPALQSANIKVLRVWLDGQSGSPKGTPISGFPSLEPSNVGSFDDTVLERYDDLMIAAKAHGVKLMISMHSWNTLQAGDPYSRRWGQSGFYTNGDATSAFDNRIKHVLTHTHKSLGKQWKDLKDYIFAFEAQNEAMIGLGQDFIEQHQGWQCDRAKTIKSVLGNESGIIVTTGGESWLDESMQPQFFTCPYLDVVAIHAYGTGDYDTGKLEGYVTKAKSAGKKLIVQEWGACYFTTSNNDCPNGSPLNTNTRSNNIKTWANQISAAGIPWMYWQIIPNNDPHEGYDYEIGVNDVNWEAFREVANNTQNYNAAFDFSEYLNL